MAFLSLSRGDPAARELLQRAIRARYGLRPPALDSRRLVMVRRGKGPLGLPVSIQTTSYFVQPDHWRWDETRKLFGFPLGSQPVSFDGTNWYERSKGPVTATDDPQVVAGARQRMWAEICFSLTPLTMPGTTLNSVDDSTFKVMRDAEPNNVATVHLDTDDSVSIKIDYYHPSLKAVVPFKLASQGGLQTLEGFVVPRQVAFQWGDGPVEIYNIVKAEANPTIALTEFVLS